MMFPEDGGMMSGDNYEIEAVSRGVDLLLPQREIRAKGRVWYAVV